MQGIYRRRLTKLRRPCSTLTLASIKEATHSTHRLQTVAELEFRRDISDRYLLETFRRRMLVLDAFIQANPEVAEQHNLRNEYFGLGNSEEAYDGPI